MNTKQPFFLVLCIIAFEILLVVTLIPGDWISSVITEEAKLVELRLGSNEFNLVQQKTKSWFDRSLIDSGAYALAERIVLPTETERGKSTGLEHLGDVWFTYMDGRLKAVAFAYYHILARIALLVSWLPYFAILLVPALFDGFTTWRIKRTNFSYISPVVHRYATQLVTITFLGLTILFLSPVVIEPTIIPSAIMLICVLSGLIFGNHQKRI